MVKMHPDGGIKRFRVHGRRAHPFSLPISTLPTSRSGGATGYSGSASVSHVGPVRTVVLPRSPPASPPSSKGIVLHGRLLPRYAH